MLLHDIYLAVHVVHCDASNVLQSQTPPQNCSFSAMLLLQYLVLISFLF